MRNAPPVSGGPPNPGIYSKPASFTDQRGPVMRTKFSAAAALLALSVLAGAALAQAPAGPPGGGAGGPPRAGGGGFGLVPMLVESKAFPDGGIVPLKNSMYGTNLLPDFKITAGPATAVSVAIIFHDLDVSMGGNTDDNLHWMAWNIPMVNGVTTIEEGKLPEGAMGSGMRGPGYAGPGAPNSPRYHHYVFEFYALSSKLDIPADTRDRNVLLAAMKGKVVAKHSYVGRFRNDTNAVMGGAGGPPRGGAGGPPPGAGGPPPGPAPGGF
jgi:phosphatidylethanolamine-binding protein (PEBP) family uncharacterized protein